MFVTECSQCGEGVPALSRACAHCGAPNRTRIAVIAVSGALVLLLAAALAAAVLILRKPAGEAGQETVAPPPAADFGWLRKAMADCDSDAAADTSTLQFLVIPLAVPKEQESEWRTKSLNDIGNAILIRSDASLEGLEGKMLKVSNEEYVFAIRDEKTDVIYKWKPSTGVVRFSTPDSDAIESFKIQFHTRARNDDNQWGATFIRQKGNCYWVNAIVSN